MKSWFWLAKLDEIAEMLRYAPPGASGTSAAAMKWAAVRDKVNQLRNLVAEKQGREKKKKGKKRGSA